MKILAFDSTARAASVAITDDDRLLALYNTDNGLTHSELLLPMAEDALRSTRLGFDDIEAYATSVGPGSFTGVRIGAALVKGLSFGRDIPCIGVSALEALAENLAGLCGIAVPVMDARRAQVYTAIFRLEDGKITRLTEDMAIPISELAERLRAFSGEKIYLSGDGYGLTRTTLDKLGVKVESTPALLISENAYSVARVALRKINAGVRTSDSELSPTYLRIPQAERERLERLERDAAAKSTGNK
ncbi:MAG: tRNA (adenosine(37)-N6)-threonylcarbamoyltransferase complex dimerization subunit type 1 TsaB [Clostridia bacterium]|nr:tRNA (adenosine(37)-N6)-threonylcarbamoyltransferase complex dimerization subunit type 1 TsaB [Clostridia bacterium]